MASVRRVTLSILLLLFVFGSVSVISNEDEFLKCQRTVKKWSDSSLNGEVKEDKHTLQNLLFFLHVPRTGGRTYFHCFLRKLYASNLECPRSYDKLHFDPSKTDCRLLVTHDDYSMMSRLPKEKTSVVTILRKPVDRVFSTYEFAVEVAARFLVHPNLTSATQMTGRPKSNGVSTLDIWPWKYLVPWMRNDLFSRRDNRRRGVFKDLKESNDPYDVEKIVMPLHEFINDPVAHDIIHNGATFQVAGLTNNSFLAEAHEVRHCVRKYQSLGKYVLEVAKKRLDDMLYVGLTEDHKGSASMFANVVGGQILSQLQGLSPTVKKVSFNETVLSSSITDSMHDTDTDHSENSSNGEVAHKISSTGNNKTRNETMTVGQLMESYEVCISSLRKSQARRRTASLKRVSPANFSKEARHQIPEMVFQQIISLNSLDVELYKHAQTIYEQQGKLLGSMRVEVERQQNVYVQRGKHLVSNTIEMGRQPNIFINSYGPISWNEFSLSIAVLLLLVLVIVIVKVRRRTLKLKI